MWSKLFRGSLTSLLLVFFSLAFLSWSGTAAATNFEACLLQEFRENLLKQESYRDLTQKQAQFLLDHMLPVAGKRVVMKAEGSLHSCSVSRTCLDLPHFSASKDLHIEWVSREQMPSLARPEIEVGEHSRTLRIPENFDLKSLPNGGQDLIQHFLMGHPLHPYIGVSKDALTNPVTERLALGEPALVLKPAQKEGIRAAIQAIERGDKSFFNVASTGLGKTEGLMAILKYKLQKPSQQKLHVLVVDQTSIANQLAADAAKLQNDTKFKLVQWGGNEKASSIDELARSALQSKEPVVLVTLVQSLKSRMGKPGTDEFDRHSKLLRQSLGTLLFDEAHHAGATLTREVVNSLIHHPDSHAFLYCTSATPMHREVPLIETISGGKAFYANLDTAESYLAQSGKVERSIDEIVDQLAISIRRGELTPVSRFDLIDPKELTAGKRDLFVRSGDHATARYVLNEEHDHALASELKDRFLAHKKGFIATAEIDEAKRIAEVFNREVPGRKFAALHSKMDEEEVLEKFKKGEINYLVTVKKLDEGVNLPDMSLYVDLNRNVGPRQIMQRIGRVLRLFHNKESSEVVALFNINEQDLREKLTLLERIMKGDFASSWDAKRVSSTSSRTGSSSAGLSSGNGPSRGLSTEDRLRGLQARLTELNKKLERSGIDPKWTPEATSDELIDFYLEYSRLPTAADGDLYGRMHKLKENPVLLSRLSELPELLQAVIDLGPKKTRLSLGKRGPKPAADVVNGFVEETLQKEGAGRLPDPKRAGLTDEEKRREAAILRWISNYREDPEFDQGLSEQSRELLSRAKTPVKQRVSIEIKNQDKAAQVDQLVHNNSDLDSRQLGLLQWGQEYYATAGNNAAKAEEIAARLKFEEAKRAPGPSADLVNQFIDDVFFKENDFRLPSSANAQEAALDRLIQIHRDRPEFRENLSVDARRLIYGDQAAPAASIAQVPVAPAPQKVLKTEPKKDLDPKARRALARHETKVNKREDYERRSAERSQHEQQLNEFRKNKIKTALELAVSKKSDLDPRELRTLEWANSELKKQGQLADAERVNQRIGRELEKKRVRAKNASANKLTAAEETLIREKVSFYGKASDDWNALPQALKELLQKRVLTRVAEDPSKAGLYLDWGKATQKTWSVKATYQGHEYRLIYNVRDGKAEVLMVGLKDMVIDSVGPRVERYFAR